MSILDEAYRLCKEVGTSPARKLIHDLILSLKNGMIEYYGHEEHAQLLGYVMVDQERARFAEGPHSLQIPPLEENQRQVLAAAHNQIVQLNKQCVAPLVDALPLCAKAIDPYNRYDYKAPTEFIEIDLLKPDSMDRFANNFHTHPQIAIAIESSKAVAPDITEDGYKNDVLKMTNELAGPGPLNMSEWLKRIFYHESDTSPYRTFARHLAALASIRESLRTLNQLIRQKISYDKLAKLDEDNIIAYGPYVAGPAGLPIIYQNAGIMFLAEKDDLILAKNMALESHPLQLWRIESLDPAIIAFPPGEPRYVELRAIDENLNPYGSLIRRL